MQEWATPQVRPLVRVYPEDGQGYMRDTCHGHKWLKRMPPDCLSPMIRLHDQDFFIFETTRLKDGRVVMPTRWFTRRVSPDNSPMMGTAWSMEQRVAMDGKLGWVVLGYVETTFATTDLLWALPRFSDLHKPANLVSPHAILGGFLLPGWLLII
jgi:hypothetical protein